MKESASYLSFFLPLGYRITKIPISKVLAEIARKVNNPFIFSLCSSGWKTFTQRKTFCLVRSLKCSHHTINPANPGAGPILRVLKYWFALQMARPSPGGPDDHVKWRLVSGRRNSEFCAECIENQIKFIFFSSMSICNCICKYQDLRHKSVSHEFNSIINAVVMIDCVLRLIKPSLLSLF